MPASDVAPLEPEFLPSREPNIWIASCKDIIFLVNNIREFIGSVDVDVGGARPLRQFAKLLHVFMVHWLPCMSGCGEWFEAV